MRSLPDYSSLSCRLDTLDGIEFVQIHLAKVTERYLLRRFALGDGMPPGQAVAFFKLNKDFGTRYNLFLGTLPLADTCDCNGFLIRGVCKHLLAARELGL